MPQKTPIYRFFAPSSGSVFYYSDELPGDAINPSIVGFTGDFPYQEQVFANSIPDPDELGGLTFWLDAEQFDAGVWNPSVDAGTGWEWVPDTSGLAVTSSGGATLIDIPADTYGDTTSTFSTYFNVNAWHVFVVGVRDEAPSLSSNSNWLNHRLLGDGAGYWGIYHKSEGGARAYGFMYNGQQYTQSFAAGTSGQLYLYEWNKPLGIEKAYFRVNNNIAITGSTTTPAVGNMNGPLVIGERMLGGLGDVLIYSGTLSAEDRDSVRAYLVNKYSLPFS